MAFDMFFSHPFLQREADPIPAPTIPGWFSELLFSVELICSHWIYQCTTYHISCIFSASGELPPSPRALFQPPPAQSPSHKARLDTCGSQPGECACVKI